MSVHKQTYFRHASQQKFKSSHTYVFILRSWKLPIFKIHHYMKTQGQLYFRRLYVGENEVWEACLFQGSTSSYMPLLPVANTASSFWALLSSLLSTEVVRTCFSWQCLPPVHVALGWISNTMPTACSSIRCSPKPLYQKLMHFLTYIASSRPAWTTQDIF